jgi:hypothetical protein
VTRIKRGLVVLSLAALGGTAALAQPALAAPSQCGLGKACNYKDIHYGGGIWSFGTYSGYFSQYTYSSGGSVDYSISSEYNDSSGGNATYYFKGQSCTGPYFTQGPNSGDSDFTNGSPSGSWNDAARSGAFAPYFGSC